MADTVIETAFITYMHYTLMSLSVHMMWDLVAVIETDCITFIHNKQMSQFVHMILQ